MCCPKRSQSLLKKKWTLVFCLLLCICCLFGISREHGCSPQRSPQESPPPPVEVAVPQSQALAKEPQSDALKETRESNFYQTIIKNNLFAPLGTDLNPKQAPGADLTLLATFINTWLTPPMALLQNTTTGQQATIAVGESFGDFRVTHVNAKNVRLQHNGEEVRLSLAPIFFLD